MQWTEIVDLADRCQALGSRGKGRQRIRTAGLQSASRILGRRELFTGCDDAVALDQHGIAETRNEFQIALEGIAYAEARARSEGQPQQTVVAPRGNVREDRAAQRTPQRATKTGLVKDRGRLGVERDQRG